MVTIMVIVRQMVLMGMLEMVEVIRRANIKLFKPFDGQSKPN